MGFGENLVSLRESRGISRKELSELLKMPYTTLRNYETNQREPGHKLLIQLSKLFNISIDALIGNETHRSSERQEPIFSKDEVLHIKKYRALDSHGKKVVDFVLSEEYARSQQQTQSAPSHSIIYLPYPLQATSAGPGDFADDESAEQIPVIRNAWTSKADYIIRVHGNSMEPEIRDGDRLLVRSQPAVDPGEIGIFIHRGERFVKVYRETFLESYNPNYEDIPVEEDTRCIGKVICVLAPEWIESKQ